ncbi:hypothetical protein [Candidatus Aalborgicola defluviihabitans]|uniref:hypothetical protein n=1 Tax=Candidatus Aalborgicola defluviihabitans TaxID=3386187 RepID=UPI0039B94706
MTDIPSKLEQIQVLISKVDVPVRQVLIEARLVEASDRFWKITRGKAWCKRYSGAARW